ncbi:MAG: PAS domain S-box protein [Burkholderiaceae bacterium]
MNSGLPEPVGPASGRRRQFLWTTLLLLVLSLLATLVWLAKRYESSQTQVRLEREASEAVADIRSSLNRNVQNLQALAFNQPQASNWKAEAGAFLRSHRELVRVEWRDSQWQVLAQLDSPFRLPVFSRLGRDRSRNEALQTCQSASRLNGPSYSGSYFVPLPDGLGMEMLDLCLPLFDEGSLTGYVLATYSLPALLDELVSAQNKHEHEVSFTEGDGTRLAARGVQRKGEIKNSAQQLLDLPGTTLVFRMDNWRTETGLFPNVLTALVAAMAIALVLILALLGKDTRRRLKAERDLADALAFRKAMEDSLVTGLRARDLQGRITYVNPAFCQMLGFSAQELLGHGLDAPYWPPERVDEYQQRHAIRLAGSVPPREGFESVFMRKDGSRVPVLIIEAPLINAQGTQTGWMSAFLDISEQRRVEELSRASQERLQATARLATVGEMASLLSHELNQPLAAISSYAAGSINLLREGAVANADMTLAMRRIAEQAARAGKVIKSVQDFVRRRDQAREAVAPQALLAAILPLVNLQARKLSVQLKTQVEPGLPRVLCDRTMVEQALLNLARNGMQAMDRADLEQRVLLIRVTQASGAQSARWLEFSVSDCGHGITPEVEQQLFTPFFTTKPEGMGLGLSLCRTVAEQHGGELSFKPNVPQGTCFSFLLPLA